MTNICFVCMGNTCRSPMAQYIFQSLVDKNNLSEQFKITSAGIYVNKQDMSLQTQEQLNKHNIPFNKHISTPLNKETYTETDYIFVMDDDVKSFLPDNRKIYKLLSFTDVFFLKENNIEDRNVTDPYGLTDYSFTYKVIYQGCKDIFVHLVKKKGIGINNG